MGFEQEFVQIVARARRVIATMVRHRIPPLPENFAEWYRSDAGSVSDRSSPGTPEAAGDAMPAGPPVGTESAVVAYVSGRLQAEVGHASEQLAAAAGSASEYGTRLSQLSGALTTKPDDPAALRAAIERMARQTRFMERQNRLLHEDLRRSASTIRGLRDELAVSRREAVTDGLTGLANRKRFDQALCEQAAWSAESGEPLSLLMLDVDHFKRFNDRYGHQTGDHVLGLVAKTLTDCVKGRDVVARIGGEEFAVLLPATALRHAAVVAEQIRATFARKKVANRSTGEDLGQITLSVGCASFSRGETTDELVRRADAALYAAKHAGRNRICAHDGKS